MSDSLTNPTPQFGTAEYASNPDLNLCRSCNQPLGENYFRINGVASCAACAKQMESQRPKDTHKAFTRALIFGAGGAIIGLILYAIFEIATGWIIGYLSLAVGYIVARALMMGSRGMGGRRYQIAAAALTYISVSMAAIPVVISQALKERDARGPVHVEQPVTSQKPADAQDLTGGGTNPAAHQQATDSSSAAKPPMTMGKALGLLTLVGLASPFLELSDPLHGFIGLFILFIGIRIAWRMTAGKPIEILGPFRTSSPALDQASAG
jgi:hypothetical protein